MSETEQSYWELIDRTEQLPAAEKYRELVEIVAGIPEAPEFKTVLVVAQLMLIEAATSALVPFTEYLDVFNELLNAALAQPEDWQTAWSGHLLSRAEAVAEGYLFDPTASLDEAHFFVQQLHQLAESYKLSARPVQWMALRAATFDHGHEGIETDFDRWAVQKPSDWCVCSACEAAYKIEHYCVIEEYDAAARLVEEVLTSDSGCANAPFNVLHDGMLALAHTNRDHLARSLLSQSMHQAHMQANPVGLATLVGVAAQIDELGVALHILSNYSVVGASFRSEWERGQAIARVGFACQELVQHGHGGALVLGLDGNFSTAAELVEPLRAEALSIAALFDERHSSTHAGDVLRSALSLRKLPNVDIGAVARPIQAAAEPDLRHQLPDEWPLLAKTMMSWGAMTPTERDQVWQEIGERVAVLQQTRGDAVVEDDVLCGHLVSVYLAAVEPALSYDTPPSFAVQHVLACSGWVASLCVAKKWFASEALVRLRAIVLIAMLTNDREDSPAAAELGHQAMEIQSALSDGRLLDQVHTGGDPKVVRLGLLRMLCVLADQSFVQEHGTSLMADVQAALHTDDFVVQRAALLLFASAGREISDHTEDLSVELAEEVLEAARGSQNADVSFHVGCTLIQFHLHAQDSVKAADYLPRVVAACATGRAQGLWGTTQRFALITNIFDASYYPDELRPVLREFLHELAMHATKQGDFPGAHFARLYLAVCCLHGNQPADALEHLRRVTDEAEPEPHEDLVNLGVYRVWFLASWTYAKELANRDFVDASTEVALRRVLVSRGSFPVEFAPFVPAITAETLAHLAITRPLGEAKALLWAHEGVAVVEQFLRNNQAFLASPVSSLFSALWREEQSAHGDEAAEAVFDRWESLLHNAAGSDLEQEQWIAMYFGLGNDFPFLTLAECHDNFHAQRAQFYLMSGSFDEALTESVVTINRCRDRVDAEVLLGMKRFAVAAKIMVAGFEAGFEEWVELASQAWTLGSMADGHNMVFSVGALLNELGLPQAQEKCEQVWNETCDAHTSS